MKTKFYGENICNLLVNLIITEFDKIDKKHITNIKITNTGKFYIINGITSIKNPLNYSEIFRIYLDEVTTNDNFINVIDLIEYNVLSNMKHVYLNKSYKINDLIPKYILKDINEEGSIFIDNDMNLIKSNSIRLFESFISKNSLKDYKFVPDMASYPFISDDFFGKNLNSDKIYEVFLKHISYNLFERNLCKDISFNLYYSGNINDLNNDNIILSIDSKTLIISLEWLESYILDSFDFSFLSIKKHLSLNEYNFESEILNDDKCWNKKVVLEDLIL